MEVFKFVVKYGEVIEGVPIFRDNMVCLYYFRNVRMRTACETATGFRE